MCSSLTQVWCEITLQEKRQETKEEEIDIDLTDPEVEKAATKIQAGFRGHKTRQDMKGKSEVHVYIYPNFPIHNWFHVRHYDMQFSTFP